uniref:Uncharacterized protein n=1 Tax=Arundo donax TaxID=35708 RepID=A0A0A9CTK4_ARUDO
MHPCDVLRKEEKTRIKCRHRWLLHISCSDRPCGSKSSYYQLHLLNDSDLQEGLKCYAHDSLPSNPFLIYMLPCQISFSFFHEINILTVFF